MTSAQLVLASTSPYRRELLDRLGLPFVVAAPRVNETALAGETPKQTALRLAQAKAKFIADSFPNALVIGSDQVVELEGWALGKPNNHENAVQQLRLMSGRTVAFHTGVCLINSSSGKIQSEVVPCSVTFRAITESEIENYLQREQPYNCAGSAKAEGLGIALIQKMQSDDPNALIGLPLIALIDMLKNEGVNVLQNPVGRKS